MMQDTLLKLYVKAQSFKNILNEEEGQDLIEYALVVALIAFAAIAGMNSLAGGINTAFVNIANKVSSET